MLRVHQRHQLRQHQLRNGQQVPLSLHHARELREVGLEPVLLVIFPRGFAQVADHLINVVFEGADFSRRFDGNGTRQVALCHGGGDIGDGAHLGGEVVGELVDVAGEVAPDARGSGNARLPAQLSFDTHFARDSGDLIGEGSQGIDHAVNGVGELCDLAFGLENQFSLEVAIGHGGDHFGDTAHLSGQVGGHGVDVIGEVFPGSGHAFHDGLAAEFTLGADFASHARHFRSEGIELVHHGVDGVLQL